ncbi:MAG: hypothetical protein AB7N76_28020 [Planctomycetota bacterium]
MEQHVRAYLVARVTQGALQAGPFALARALAPPRARFGRLVRELALGGRERAFALALLRARPNLWLYRVNQRAHAGDFAVVDLSSPRPELRPLWVLELKAGQPARSVSPTFLQLRNAVEVARALARAGLVAQGVDDGALLLGAGEELLRWFALKGAERSRPAASSRS